MPPTSGNSGCGCSAQARQTESRGDLAHLSSGNLLGLVKRLVGRGQNHVFQELSVGGIERLRVNLDRGKRAVALRQDLYGAAAAGRLDRAGGQGPVWICSICCCMRAACFMSLPMLDIAGKVRVNG